MYLFLDYVCIEIRVDSNHNEDSNKKVKEEDTPSSFTLKN